MQVFIAIIHSYWFCFVPSQYFQLSYSNFCLPPAPTTSAPPSTDSKDKKETKGMVVLGVVLSVGGVYIISVTVVISACYLLKKRRSVGYKRIPEMQLNQYYILLKYSSAFHVAIANVIIAIINDVKTCLQCLFCMCACIYLYSQLYIYSEICGAILHGHLAIGTNKKCPD